jgi:FtsH ternary system domain X6
MTTVRPFEADLLRILHAVLGRGPVDRAVAVVLGSRPRPKCLSRDALGLIEDTLAKGCVRKFARRESWRRERFLRGDRIVEGRLWERTTPEALGLTFSDQSLEFLIRLVTDNPSAWNPKHGPKIVAPTLGDSILLYFVFEAFRSTKIGESLRKLPVYWSEGLCRLAFPIDFAEVADAGDPDLSSWLDPRRVWVLEALQGPLAEAWVMGDRQKRQISEPARVVAIAREQGRVIEAFCSVVEASGRRDLARFLLRVARELLELRTGLDSWIGALDLSRLRLADRTEATRASLAILAVLERLQRWEREARDVGYFDEGYASAQLWKSDWERFEGDELRTSAHFLFRLADPLASGN